MERTDSFFIRASVLTDSTNFNQSAIDLGASQDDDLILINDQLDVGPQDFTDGYLIAVEQMNLGVDQRSTVTAQVSVVLECTVYGSMFPSLKPLRTIVNLYNNKEAFE